MVYYPAQYIPADEVLVRVPRQLGPGGPQGPLRPIRQSDFAADQEASADTAYGAAPVSYNILDLNTLVQKNGAVPYLFEGVLSPPGETFFQKSCLLC